MSEGLLLKPKTKTMLKKVAAVLATAGVVAGLVLFVLFLCDRYPHKFTVDLSYDNVFIGEIVSENREVDGKPAFGFWQLVFVKHGNMPSTPKEVRLFLGIGDKWHQGQLHNVMTGRALKKDGVFDNVLWTNYRSKSLLIFDWHNLGLLTGQETMQQDELLKGSALFVFDIPKEDMVKAETFKFELEDYSGKTFGTEVYPISPQWVETYGNGLTIIDRYFNMEND